MTTNQPSIGSADQLLKLHEVVGGDVSKQMSSIDTLSPEYAKTFELFIWR